MQPGGHLQKNSELESMISRKQFIQRVATATAGTALLGFRDFIPAKADRDLTFDLHCHPGQFYRKGTTGYDDQALARTITLMNSSHLSGAFFSLVADAPLIQIGPTGVIVSRQFQPGEAWAEYQRQLTLLKEWLPSQPVRFSTRANDLTDGSNKGRVAAFLSVEGGDFLEGNTGRLEQAYLGGIRSVQIVHYAQNDIGDLQTSASIHGGLSPFGKDVVKKMNALGMVIDVAHASFETVKDVVAISSKPVILSHSILAMESDRPIALRAITPEHAKLVAGTGGLIGCWPSGFNKSFDEFVDNTMRMVDVAGIDHVGLGTDMDSNFKPVLDSYAQVSRWTTALKAKGLSVTDVQKLAGGNAVRVIREVVG